MAGLLVFVIVGAWLAVLVPMALKSHDSSTALKSADSFSDAMRVLSRRGARDVLVPRRGYTSMVVSATKSIRSATAAGPFEADLPAVKTARTPAERRLRSLLVLVGFALVSLGLGLYGVRLMLAAHVVVDLLIVLFVVHLRRQAVLKAQRSARRARAASSLGAPARADRPVRQAPRIAGIPDRMPTRPAPLSVPLPAPAARYEDRPLPDTSWSPVPVPTPMYVGKAVAPRRQPRVLDLTKPGAWTATLEGDDVGMDIFDDGTELDDILERRRAAGDW